MPKDLWINLPVKDINVSKAFYTAIGFTPNPGPGNSPVSVSFLIGSQKVVLMLFAENVFAGFTQHQITNTTESTEVLFSLGADTCEEVDAYANKAETAGGTVFGRPGEKDGWMYGCGFTDPDGHRWNALYMDMSKMPKK